MLSLNPLSKFLSLFHSLITDETTIFRSDIISGPIWESFLVQFGNQFRSNLGIICGSIWGSFAGLYNSSKYRKRRKKVNTTRSVMGEKRIQ